MDNPNSKQQGAVALLIADHKKVKQMFKQYETLCNKDAADEEKSNLAAKICAALTVHTHIEEEIFYPAVRAALDEDDMLDEAEVEHASAKDLIAQLESMQAGDELYDAKVTVLGEYIAHHVKEEESEMFPKVKKSRLDLGALGNIMAERKEELKEEMGEDVHSASISAKSGLGAKLSSKSAKGNKSLTH